MATCPACGGDGECKNEYHTRDLDEKLASIVVDIFIVCPDCGSGNTEMGGNCSTCGGTGEI